jgi:endonuclease/exonuclease/phosphatase family metal-dependent hydrolase
MSSQGLRIATFNIHHGAGRDGKVDIGRTADVILSLEADLIALQELDVHVDRSGDVDQPAELGDRLGMEIFFSAAFRLHGGEYGIGVAARGGFKGVTETLPRVGDEEPRVAIMGSWNKIGFVSTHLSRDPVARAAQTKAAASLAARLPGPAIVLGDMNQRSRALTPLRGVGFTPVTARRTLLQMITGRGQIDHILTTAEIEVLKVWEVPTVASDHSALVTQVVVHA